jgi:hypothetical protein
VIRIRVTNADPDPGEKIHLGIHTTYVYLARILRDGCRYGVIQERRSEGDASDIHGGFNTK